MGQAVGRMAGMVRRAFITTAVLAATLLAACGRPADTEGAPVAAAPAAPAAVPPSAAPPPAQAVPVPMASIDADAIAAQVWRVRASSAVAVGSLYVFLPDGTLLLASPGSPPATGTWQRRPEGGITMVEASLPYKVDVLEATAQRLRLRSHNPGTPVDIALEPAPAPLPVPPAFVGEWNARAADCGRAGTETRLRLEPGRVRLHESAGDLLAVLPDGQRDLALVSRMSGEGQSRLALRRYRLAADGATLTDVTDGAAGGLARRRCP